MEPTTNGRRRVRSGLAVGLTLKLVLVLPVAGAWALGATGTAAAQAAPEVITPAQKKPLSELLDTDLTEVRFQGAWLQDVLDYLRDASGKTVLVDWRRLAALKVDHDSPITINVKNVKFSDVLKQILAQVGDGKQHPAFAAQGEVLVISTPAGLEAQAAAAKALAAGHPSSALRETLNRPIPEANIRGVALADALEAISGATHLSFEVDWKALKEAGVERNTAVSGRFTNIPTGQAVSLLLGSIDAKKPIGMTIEGDKVLIGPLPAPQK